MNVLSYTCHSTADELSLTMCPNLAFNAVCNPATKELCPSSTVAILYLLSEDGCGSISDTVLDGSGTIPPPWSVHIDVPKEFTFQMIGVVIFLDIATLVPPKVMVLVKSE